MLTIFGSIAAAIGAVQFMPQTRRAWQQRHDPIAMRALAVPTYVLVLISCSLWIAYGVGQRDLIIIAPNVCIIVLALVTVWCAVRGRRIETAPAT